MNHDKLMGQVANGSATAPAEADSAFLEAGVMEDGW